MSSSEEDLAGFIVPDRKRKRKDDSESESEESLEEEVPELPEDGPELAKVLEEEAKAITGNINATVVNGRTLRDRTKITSPKDQYWERFGTKTMAKLSVVEEKREMLDDIKAWKKEFNNDPGCPPITWPNLTLKDSIDKIKEAHQYVIDTLELELRDDDDLSDEEEDDDTSDVTDEEEDEESLDDDDEEDEEEEISSENDESDSDI